MRHSKLPKLNILTSSFIGILFLVFSTNGTYASPVKHRDSSLLLFQFVFIQDDKIYAYVQESQGAAILENNSISDVEVPLGSLWKLFVYTYLDQTQSKEMPYQCQGTTEAEKIEDSYCCDTGQTINRQVALVQSCSAYFSPRRLNINAISWSAYWKKQIKQAPAWLLQLDKLKPDTKTRPSQLLTLLNQFTVEMRKPVETTLLNQPLSARLRGTVEHTGGVLRVKTFTWKHPDIKGAYFGGFAGWTTEGIPIWAGGLGSSHEVLRKYAKPLVQLLPQTNIASNTSVLDRCVKVNYFSNYPLLDIKSLHTRQSIKSGILDGAYIVYFRNGNRINLRSTGEMEVRAVPDKDTFFIAARMPLDEYIGRVIDREADAKVTEAAKALSILIRTYVLKNGVPENGCLRVDDSSHMQRVAPRAASHSSLKIARFTEGLILEGLSFQYHSTQASLQRMSWSGAVKLAKEEENYVDILRYYFPQSSLATQSGESECMVHPQAQQWLNLQLTRWQRKLHEPGLEWPDRITVCQLSRGNPFADSERMRIYVKGAVSLNDRVTLAHESLHIALRHHPNGENEDYVEGLARWLIDEWTSFGIN